MDEKLIGAIALALASAFTGMAFYITYVEQPARLLLDNHGLLIEWQHSCALASRFQGTLAIASGIAGVWAHRLSKNWRWLVGSVLILINWPYAFTVMMQISSGLLALDVDLADGRSRAAIEQWAMLHRVDDGLGLAAMIAFVWALTDSGEERSGSRVEAFKLVLGGRGGGGDAGSQTGEEPKGPAAGPTS